MVSKMPTLKVLLWPRAQYWRRGAFSRRILGRPLSNQYSRSFSKSKGSCPAKPKSPDCTIPEVDTCEPPGQSSPGREKGQLELMPCVPDCLPGKPKQEKRGCLPWEKGVEMCPTKNKPRKLETPSCEHICEPYVGQGVIDKLKVSTCEYRRFKKCFEKTKDPQMCLDLGPTLLPSKKEYPMMHAVHKKYIPGCPITLQRSFKKQNQDCDN